MYKAVFAAAILFSTQISATTIVVIRTDTTVVMGADSKIGTDQMASGSHGDYTTCKIGGANGVFWGASGLYGDGQGYDLANIAMDVMSRNISFSERVSAFEATILPTLQRVLAKMKADSPDYFTRKYGNGEPVVEIVFVTFDDGVPNVFQRSFDTKSDASSVEVIRRMDLNRLTGDTNFLFMGFFEKATKEIAQDGLGLLKTYGIQGLVAHLVAEQITADPAIDGLPISVLTITKGGIKWYMDGKCHSP
jgi:hypothetical protein